MIAFGGLSRNKQVGLRLAKGESCHDILASMKEVAEGVPTAAVAVELAEKHGLQLPIFKAVHAILQGRLEVHDASRYLFSLPLSEED